MEGKLNYVPNFQQEKSDKIEQLTEIGMPNKSVGSTALATASTSTITYSVRPFRDFVTNFPLELLIYFYLPTH